VSVSVWVCAVRARGGGERSSIIWRGNGKAIPEGSRRLRHPDFKTVGT
jgi:hypothetical protein